MSDYKETLNLPKTDFPMKAGLTAREPEMLAKWEREGLYEKIQAARAGAPVYILHDGPPFANGDVHMGTALNKVLKDFVIKSRTMLGFRAPFVPGWDCHGLPIEFKVVQESRGLAPVEVRKRSEAYARKFIDIQRGQFRRLGVLGDWDHPYLTLDPGYEAEIIRSFATFVEKGLVYQSKKPVYWSTGAQTALAEAEVEYADREDPAIFVKFPIPAAELERAGLPADKPASLVIWTTTPWTLPANVAVAVHPDIEYEFVGTDTERFLVARKLFDAFQEIVAPRLTDKIEFRKGRDLVGLRARHPFLDRDSVVIAADFVTTDTGTGQVHIAPGHGADDYVAGIENGLPILSPVDEHGRFTEEVGVPVWAGKYVFDANKEVIEHLRERGALLAEEVYRHSYPHCWRSKTPVIFRAVEQFFIRIDAIREAALEAIDGVQWLPHWGRNRIRGTVESRPDWCISRQRTWGVPLPVFYDAAGRPILDPGVIRRIADAIAQDGTNAWFEQSDAAWCERVGLPAGCTRRNDTLDVWLDSGVSHEAVLRRRPELQFPADLYIEATDQHRGWFQSSLMTSVAMNGVAPYRAVLTHGFVVDVDTRAKISKSAQGGYKKPTEAEHYVGKYGADLVRLWVSSVNFTDDVPFSEELFKRLSDAYRRIRNTLRILLANTSDFPDAAAASPTLVDIWLDARLQELIALCRDACERLEFHRVFHAINQFCAIELSSLYVDVTKDRLYCDRADSPRRRATQAAMRGAFEAVCKLLAPILAFTADEAWGYFKPGGSIHLELLPEVDPAKQNPEAIAAMARLLAFKARITQAVDAAQQAGAIGSPLEAHVVATVADAPLLELLRRRASEIEELFILSHLEIAEGAEEAVAVDKTARTKCERCWRHRPDVGREPAHPMLCGRCAEAVIA